jgi:hypothetical protein
MRYKRFFALNNINKYLIKINNRDFWFFLWTTQLSAGGNLPFRVTVFQFGCTEIPLPRSGCRRHPETAAS